MAQAVRDVKSGSSTCSITRCTGSGGGTGAVTSLSNDPLKVALCRTIPNRLLQQDVPVPPLYRARHFVNLTNGLEALPLLHELGLPYSYCRICSTDIEQQNYEALIAGLDSNLLMSLALGHTCCVWDLGSRNKKRGAPRAIWAGLEFIRWCLASKWLDFPEGSLESPQAHLRGHRVTATFEGHRRRFSQSTKRRMLYYRRYVPEGTQRLELYGVYRSTVNDSDHQHYVGIARHWDSPTSAAHALEELQQQCTEHDPGQHSPQQQQQQQQQWQGIDQGVVAGAAGCHPYLEAWDVSAWQRVVQDGWGVFAGGLGHADYFPAMKLLGGVEE